MAFRNDVVTASVGDGERSISLEELQDGGHSLLCSIDLCVTLLSDAVQLTDQGAELTNGQIAALASPVTARL